MNGTLAPDEVRELLTTAGTARLATASPSLGVDVVPVALALVREDDGWLVAAVNAGPPSPTRLRRLRNLQDHPEVTLLADGTGPDETGRWAVRLRGTASVVAAGERHERAGEALTRRHGSDVRRPVGPIVVVAVEDWSGWRRPDARGSFGP